MKAYKDNIERVTLDNKFYRKVLFTTKQMQLVVMYIPTGEEIGVEIHKSSTQFIRIEAGTGVARIGNKRYNLKAGDAVVIPSGIKHDIIATNNLQLYTLYAPPQHPPNTKEHNKEPVS